MKSAFACLCMLLVACSADYGATFVSPSASSGAGPFKVGLAVILNKVKFTVTSFDGIPPRGTVRFKFTGESGKVVTQDEPIGGRRRSLLDVTRKSVSVTIAFPNLVGQITIVAIFTPGNVADSTPNNNAAPVESGTITVFRSSPSALMGITTVGSYMNIDASDFDAPAPSPAS